MRAEIKAVKVKKALEKAKGSILEILGEVKSIVINMDFDSKKHTIEVNTK